MLGCLAARTREPWEPQAMLDVELAALGGALEESSSAAPTSRPWALQKVRKTIGKW